MIRLTILLVLLSTFLVACGGGSSSEDSAGVGGTGIVYGKATGFGSIFVNGTRYMTNRSQFDVDGDTNANQSDLAVGMVVQLEVDIEDGQLGRDAIRVTYDDEVQGPISAITISGTEKVLNIFGQTITVDQLGTVFDGTSFATLAVNDVVEISGFRTSDTEITATFVEFKGVLVPGLTEVELRGTISGFDLINREFIVDGTTIRYNGATEIDVPTGLFGNGTYVEIEGIYQADTSVLADEIEHEEPGFDDDIDEISLQGIVSNYVSISDFEIGGIPVNASGAELEPANAASLLEDGVEVEVEGEFVAGVLKADELEIREGESRLETFVSAINLGNNSFEVSYAPLAGSIVVLTDAQTQFEDGSSADIENFSLDQLNIGDFVRVEGVADGGQVTASEVKREDPDDSKLRGKVDAFIADTSITILGITYLVDATTEYDDFPNANAFFSQLTIGDLIEIEDEEVADGIADEVEEED